MLALTNVDYVYNLSYVLLNSDLHKKMKDIHNENNAALIEAGDKLSL